MRRALILGTILGIGVVAGGGLWWLKAEPPATPTPPPAAAKSRGPTISWSSPKLDATLFPGTSSTTVLTFRSNENLGGVVVEATSSLTDIVSISPASFSSIAANTEYQLTLTFTAPPEFKKWSFGGTLHIRNSGKPPKTYAQPLNVSVRTNFSTYVDSNTGVSFAYPTEWTSERSGDHRYFTRPPNIEVMEIEQLNASQTPFVIAQAAITKNDCTAFNLADQPVDRLIDVTPTSVLFVLSCSATTDDYKYIFLTSLSELVELTYHDDFESTDLEYVKLSTFQAIIHSLSK